MKRSGVFEHGPSGGGEETPTEPRVNEEPTPIAAIPWHRRALAFFTVYRELSAARVAEDFASLQSRIQQEWTFDGGFVSRL